MQEFWQEDRHWLAAQSQESSATQPVASRAELIAQLEGRLQGQVSDHDLAAWAFDRFYAEEIGSQSYEADAAPLIAEILDALMFCDDPAFQLGEEELRALLARLTTL